MREWDTWISRGRPLQTEGTGVIRPEAAWASVFWEQQEPRVARGEGRRWDGPFGDGGEGANITCVSVRTRHLFGDLHRSVAQGI